MTSLERPVRRRTRFPFAHYRKRLVVTLEPGDTIAMRLERTRTPYRGTLASVYWQLIEWHIEAERQLKRKSRKKRRVA